MTVRNARNGKRWNGILAAGLLGTALWAGAASASAPGLAWQSCKGGTQDEEGRHILALSGGGSLTVGATNSSNGDITNTFGQTDFWALKRSAAGGTEWSFCFGGTENDAGAAVVVAADGGYLAVGTTSSNNGMVTGNHGGSDVWVVKLTTAGGVEWQRCFGGSSQEGAADVITTADGGFLVVGWTTSDNGDVSGRHSGEDAWVLKISATGVKQWQKCLGGSQNDQAKGVVATADGGYLVAGWTYSNNGDVAGNHGDRDAWVVKIDASGNRQWSKCYGGAGDDAFQGVVRTTDGSYALAGYTDSSGGDVSGNHGGFDVWLVKTNTAGSLRWQKCYGGTGHDVGRSIQETPDRGFLVGGENASPNNGQVSGNHGAMDLWILRLDEGGTLVWQKSLGGTANDRGYRAVRASDGTLLAVGFTATQGNDGDVFGNHGLTDLWTVKLDVDPLVTPKPTPSDNGGGGGCALGFSLSPVVLLLLVPLALWGRR